MFAWLRRRLRRPALTQEYRELFERPTVPPLNMHELSTEEAATDARERIMRRLEAEFYALTRGHRNE